MLAINQILVPLDFSQRSIAVAEHGVVMARRFDAQLMFVYVIPPYEAHAGNGDVLWHAEQDVEAISRERMGQLVSQVSGGLPIETVILEGDPAKHIEEMARQRGVDLVMLPTHGYGTFRRLLLGSVSAKVLHDVACPVFTGTHIPENPVYRPDAYQRVACAIDLSEHSERVLRWAWGFAQSWEAELDLIHAAPVLYVSGTDRERIEDELFAVETASKAIKELVAKVECRAGTLVNNAEVISYVPETAAKIHADVLIIGRSLPHGWFGRLRTHAYALIRESPCPVISV